MCPLVSGAAAQLLAIGFRDVCRSGIIYGGKLDRQYFRLGPRWSRGVIAGGMGCGKEKLIQYFLNVQLNIFAQNNKQVLFPYCTLI